MYLSPLKDEDAIFKEDFVKPLPFSYDMNQSLNKLCIQFMNLD